MFFVFEDFRDPDSFQTHGPWISRPNTIVRAPVNRTPDESSGSLGSIQLIPILLRENFHVLLMKIPSKTLLADNEIFRINLTLLLIERSLASCFPDFCLGLLIFQSFILFFMNSFYRTASCFFRFPAYGISISYYEFPL